MSGSKAKVIGQSALSQEEKMLLQWLIQTQVRALPDSLANSDDVHFGCTAVVELWLIAGW